MQKISRIALLVVLLLMTSIPVLADPIISASGPADTFSLIDPTHVLAVGWNQNASFAADISVSFLDPSILFDEPTVYSAYLVDSLGAGPINQVAQTTFTAGPDLSNIVLFSNLLLGSGSYFLVIGLSPDQNSLFPEGNWGATDPLMNPFAISTAPGVIDLGQFFAQDSDVSTYLPGSNFVQDTSGGPRLLYDVQAVPEPSTLLLALGPALALIVLRRKRS